MTAATTDAATRESGPVRLFVDTTFEGKVMSWLPDAQIEEGAKKQIWNLAALPSSVHVAVMPDVHQGFGMPIGCALATEGTVVPGAVGVDIGCGMIAEPLGVPAELLPVRAILEGILRRVPVGIPGMRRGREAGSFITAQGSEVLREWAESSPGDGNSDMRERADRQIGTLGSGNHFIELQADEAGEAWVMLHSGSRSLGKAICEKWHRRALEWCDRYRTPLSDRDLAFLAIDTPDGEAYMREMGYAMRYAEENRARMLDAVHAALADAGAGPSLGMKVETHHNFASVERHMGREFVIHRKGAVRASAWPAERKESEPEDARLVVTIPGSMQTGSYIGVGRANMMALNTCAHGAGRRFGRKAFVRQSGRHAYAEASGIIGATSSEADVTFFCGTCRGRSDEPQHRTIGEDMEAQGLYLVTPQGADALDESGAAYKDIEDVMRYQADLVEPRVKLRPLGTVKG